MVRGGSATTLFCPDLYGINPCIRQSSSGFCRTTPAPTTHPSDLAIPRRDNGAVVPVQDSAGEQPLSSLARAASPKPNLFFPCLSYIQTTNLIAEPRPGSLTKTLMTFSISLNAINSVRMTMR